MKPIELHGICSFVHLLDREMLTSTRRKIAIPFMCFYGLIGDVIGYRSNLPPYCCGRSRGDGTLWHTVSRSGGVTSTIGGIFFYMSYLFICTCVFSAPADSRRSTGQRRIKRMCARF